MGISDHYRGGMTERLMVTIITVDPATSRVEVVGKDAAVIQINVSRTGAIFRWPNQGEIWSIIRENGEWALEDCIESPNSKQIGTLAPGEAMIQSNTIWTPAGEYLITNVNLAALAADTEADLAAHSADTTAVHGIADTSILMIEGDAAGGDLSGTYPNPRRPAIGAFEVQCAGTVGPSGAGTLAIPMTVENFDVSGWYDTTTSRYTPQLAGYYLLQTHFHMTTVLPNGNRFIAGVGKNGSGYRFGNGEVSNGLGVDRRVDCSVIALSNGTTDFWTPMYNHDSATNMSVGAESRFYGCYLGA